jgi:tetratricopeptide (TPR) repeat protein
MRLAIIAASLFPAAWAASPEFGRAQELYQRTEYQQALDILKKDVLKKLPSPGAEELLLFGQAYYGLAKYSDATAALEKAAKLAPKSADIQHWLGRAWGRRAESSFALNQPRYAIRAREAFERAVELDPNHRDALDDLFEYYVEAPGFLGGGLDKAAALAPRMAALDPAWGAKAQARLAQERLNYRAAEDHLRRATRLAPDKPGPRIDLARFLARQNRIEESDTVFAEAARIAPEDPEVWFARAKTLVEKKRNLSEARQLLERYLAAALTPDHPPRAEARALLAKAR